MQFIEICDSVSIQQHIKQETHISGNTLDLELNECGDSEEICDVQTGPFLPEHCVVLIAIEFPKSTVIAKKVKFKNWKKVSVEPYNNVNSLSLNYDSNSFSDCVHQFNNGLSAILNVHAPENWLE